MGSLTRFFGFSYLGSGLLLVLFILQECHRFDESQLASPFFLLVPAFLGLAVPLVLGGAAWVIWERSETMDRSVRVASIRVAAVILVICLLTFLLAKLLSPSIAAKSLWVGVPAGGLSAIWIIKLAFSASRDRGTQLR